VWQCWRNHTPYDPERHRALQRHITVTIPARSGPVPDLAATQRMAGTAVTRSAVAGSGAKRLTANRYPLSNAKRLTQDVFGDIGEPLTLDLLAPGQSVRSASNITTPV